MKKIIQIPFIIMILFIIPFSCSNSPGNAEKKSGSSAGDTTPPVITISCPTNYQEVGTNFSVAGMVSDDSSGVDKVFIKYHTNDYTETALSNGLWYTNINAYISSGTNTNLVYAVDKAGNASTPVMILISRQSIPYIVITNVTYGQVVSNASLEIKGKCLIDNPYSINDVYLFTIANGATNAVTASVSPPDWKVWTTLQPDTNWLVASALGSNGKSNYSAPILVVRDSARPVPGNFGEVSVTGVHETRFYASWLKAQDNYTSENDLQYRILTIRSGDSYTNIPMGWSPGASAFQVETGLEAARQYTVVLSVRDGVGNISNYKSTNITTPDETPPVPGSSGSITMAGASTNSLVIAWNRGTDNVTSKGSIQYKIVRSLSGNIQTVDNAENNGILVSDWTTYSDDSVTNTVSGLNGSTTYYVNVLTKDAAGNKAAYIMNSGTTLSADGPRPVPGNNGTLAWTFSTYLWINWTKATDVNTPQSGLTYKLFRSSMNNIDTVSNILLNGTEVCIWQTDIDTMCDPVGPVNFTYYNVLVRDASGNLSNYTSMMYYNP